MAEGLSLQLPVYLGAALGAVASTNAGQAGKQTLPGGLFYFETRQPMRNIRETGRRAADTGSDSGGALLDMLAMDGFVIGGEDTYKETYEKSMASGKKSGVVQGVALKKDGAYAARVFAPDYDDYEIIQRAVSARMQIICAGISGGVFDVTPYKKQSATPCRYCGFGGVCGFDLVSKNARYRAITVKKDKEYMEALRALYKTPEPAKSTAERPRGNTDGTGAAGRAPIGQDPS
jgi:ATP-dependent helicase/nuclease subunit B